MRKLQLRGRRSSRGRGPVCAARDDSKIAHGGLETAAPCQNADELTEERFHQGRIASGTFLWFLESSCSRYGAPRS